MHFFYAVRRLTNGSRLPQINAFFFPSIGCFRPTIGVIWLLHSLFMFISSSTFWLLHLPSDFFWCLVEEAAGIREACGVVGVRSEQTAERAEDSGASERTGIGQGWWWLCEWRCSRGQEKNAEPEPQASEATDTEEFGPRRRYFLYELVRPSK